MTISPSTAPQISHFNFPNGLELIVIPDRRAPVVTHMIYYRNGAGDDPMGKSGIAHFLEHLMFKGTEKNPGGAFSETVAALGGQENAFTGHDTTAYFQRVAKEHLGAMMALEADRMTGLILKDEEVASERNVVLEERKMRVDSDPASQLREGLLAALHVHHPYGIPIIGWEHEIEGLGREDALAYYRRFYCPENAVLIVAGDVEAEEVHALAKATYGQVARKNTEAPQRNRVKEPVLKTSRFVSVADAKVEQPMAWRAFTTPCYAKATGKDAFALEVLAQLLGGSQTSRLHRSLVVSQGVSVSCGAQYWGDALDSGMLWVYALPSEGKTLAELDAAIDGVLEEFRTTLAEEKDIARAKTRLIADMTFAQDSQSELARIYGATLTCGGTLDDVKNWPERIRAVTAEDVRKAAQDWLKPAHAAIGHLIKAAA